MIFVRDKGQMCNNILQYAHFYSWARENKRSCMSMRFAYKYQYFKICDTKWHNIFVYVIAKLLAKIHLLPIADYRINDCKKVEQMIHEHKHIIVEGWNIRYYDLFLKHKQEIVDLFAFKKHISEKTDMQMNPYLSKDNITIGVHIRRGDYKTFYNGKYYFDDNTYIDYIQQAAKLLTGKNVVVYICSNDPTLNKDKYKKELYAHQVCFPQGNAAEDLCLLSKCDYLIGPPSSYSLVAAMYGNTLLHWMKDSKTELRIEDFKNFDTQFRRFDEYWMP